MELWLDWASLPKPFDWMTNQPNPPLDITIATVFSQKYAIRVVQLCLWEAQCKASAWLSEVASMDQGLPCPVD